MEIQVNNAFERWLYDARQATNYNYKAVVLMVNIPDSKGAVCHE